MLMKAAVLAGVGWCWLMVGQVLAADGAKLPVRLAVELTDGSRVVGGTRQDAGSMRNDSGRRRCSLRLVDQVRWKAGRQHVVWEMANGDRITVASIPEVLQLETLFGTARIPMQHVVLLKSMPLAVPGT